uniref:SAM domain-containing protein n=1 Tax=Hucho hucho TaxID=62062 RepID=A0A4W5R7E4_9TELE
PYCCNRTVVTVLYYNCILTVQYVCVVCVQVLETRRAQCEHQDQDPVVWTCHRVIKWIRDIDLKEYADSLHGRGVHGAVLALDPSFDADAMAKALGIPSHKHMLHRHMYEEMKALSIPAR